MSPAWEQVEDDVSQAAQQTKASNCSLPSCQKADSIVTVNKGLWRGRSQLMREPLFSGETWEMSDSPGSGNCAPSPTPGEGGEIHEIAWLDRWGGVSRACGQVAFVMPSCGSSWSPL